jgi:hypothetical protein
MIVAVMVWGCVNVGFVDDRYVRAVPDSPLRRGQRVTVSEADARRAIAQAQLLCRAIAGDSAPTT